MRLSVALAVGLLLATPTGTTGASPAAPLRLSTTTSTEHSGLLRDLLPAFERRTGVRVEVIAVGSGKALKLAENGDVDVVLSHSPELEEEFVRRGFGVNRRAVLRNDFVLVGPPADPAGVRGAGGAAEALHRIAAAKVPFVSRGDDSGTHRMERRTWALAAIEPRGSWYIAAGQGMGPVLLMADERRGYALADRATYLSYAAKIESAILLDGDEAFLNPYSVIATNPARHPQARYLDAMLLIAWLTSPEGQQRIGAFAIEGQTPFRPLAVAP